MYGFQFCCSRTLYHEPDFGAIAQFFGRRKRFLQRPVCDSGLGLMLVKRSYFADFKCLIYITSATVTQ